MDDALALLRLHLEWGADEALEQRPLDRLRASGQPVAPLARAAVAAEVPAGVSTTTVPAASVLDQPRLTAAERAAGLAGQAATPDALREIVAAFDGCALRDTASHLVFAEGDPTSSTLIIGEPPGREEDRGGHPFAGAEGALLDQMLASIGLDRSQLMVTPLLPWRPPGGRPANVGEVAICLPFLHRLIVLLAPRRLVLFGATGARALLPPALARRRQNPAWLDCRIPGMPEALPTLHLPALADMQHTLPLRRTAWVGLRLLYRAIHAEITQT